MVLEETETFIIRTFRVITAAAKYGRMGCGGHVVDMGDMEDHTVLYLETMKWEFYLEGTHTT
jgi:hypothetical protein